MEGYAPGGCIGFYPMFECAVCRGTQAGIRSDKSAIKRPRCWRTNTEKALEGGNNIRRGHGLAVGEGNVGAQRKRVTQPAILRGWQGFCQIGHDLLTRRACDLTKSGEPIIHIGKKVYVFASVVDLGVQCAARSRGNQPERSACMFGQGEFGGRCRRARAYS
jgi:hypothetical protein